MDDDINYGRLCEGLWFNVRFQLLEQQHIVVHFSKISPDGNVELASLYKLC